MRFARRSTIPLVACLGALLLAAGCAGEHGAAGATFEPAHPGVLTVATAFLPAPGFWEGRPPTGGFEAGLARALARRFGLSRVRVVQVPFADITHGRLDGADIALSQLTPTSERTKRLDFTTAYLESPPAVLARTSVEGSDVKDLRGLRWVVSTLSTLTPIVMQQIHPTLPRLVVDDRSQALAALESGAADALMLDLPVALGLADADPHVHVLGQLDGEEDLAGALPKGSPNAEIVNSTIRGLQADGTIDRLSTRWLGNEADVPLILTQQ